MTTMRKQIDGDCEGFNGESVFVMTDGSIYRQTEYYYWYSYSYMPHVTIVNDREIVIPNAPKVIRVERLK